ncbi:MULTISPECIES: Kelch repeat-containing protein [unclassified Bacillus (in: firmicutes)]
MIFLKKNILIVLFLIFLSALLTTTASVEAQNADQTEVKTWEGKEDLPKELSLFSTAVIDGKIYVIGGNNNGKVQNQIYVYDPKQNKWIEKVSMNEGREGAAIAVVDHKIYVIGGYGEDNSGSKTYLKTVEVYDINTDSWTKGIELPKPLTGSSATVIGKDIYLIGGFNPSEGPTSNTYIYNTDTKTWSEKSSLPIPLRALSTATVKEKIYAIGGENKSGFSNSIFEYDPKTDNWTFKYSLRDKLSYIASTVYNNKIYLMGGSDSSKKASNSSVIYDPVANTVNDFQNLTSSRVAAGAATIKNNIFIIGGTTKGGSIAVDTSGMVKTVQVYTEKNPDDNLGDPSSGGNIPEEGHADRAILTITMTNGLEKEFDLSMEELNSFVNWYDQKDSGTGPSRYEVDKHDNNIGPFENRKDHVIFKNILTFEVNEYSTNKSSNQSNKTS